MKGIMAEVPEDLLEDRRRTGADRWDEMWEGVLHIPPAPNRTHQDFEFQLELWLRDYWAKPQGNRVYHQINLASAGSWPDDYRIPDLVLLTPDRFEIDQDAFFEGPPLVVVEIHSPGDESYEKLDFYAKLGVPETWIIHRDSRKPEIYLLNGNEYREAEPDADGWLKSTASGVWMKPRRPKKLLLQRGAEAATRGVLPE
ncbi:MAG: Uma2 family endonuclease [Planctomycetaceae bacterium]|nr:Uma2 family endonuclease [Planctomycetaceae bacterium]